MYQMKRLMVLSVIMNRSLSYDSSIRQGRSLAVATRMDIVLYNKRNRFYDIIVRLGSHQDQMPLALDTSSKLTWMPDNSCPYKDCPKGYVKRYDCFFSKTCQTTQKRTSLFHGDDIKVEGTLASDSVALGTSFASLPASGLDMVLISRAYNLKSMGSSGVLGLAPTY